MTPAQMTNEQIALLIADNRGRYPDETIEIADKYYRWLESKKSKPGPIKYYNSTGEETKDPSYNEWLEDHKDKPEDSDYMRGFIAGYNEGLYDKENK